RGGQLAPHDLELLRGGALHLGASLHEIRAFLVRGALVVELLPGLLQLAPELGHGALQLVHLAAPPLQLGIGAAPAGRDGARGGGRRGGTCVGGAPSEDEEREADDQGDGDEDEQGRKHGAFWGRSFTMAPACSTPSTGSCSSPSSERWPSSRRLSHPPSSPRC